MNGKDGNDIHKSRQLFEVNQLQLRDLIILAKEETNVDPRVLQLVFANSSLFAHEFLQIVELLHSLSKVFLKGFIPLLDWILFRVAFGVSNGEFFGASSSIVYFLGKFSKLFLLTVCLKALIKSHLIKGLDEAEFPRLRWSNDHHIKVVNLCFFRDILSEESIVSKIRLLQKCVHIWKGRV